MNIYLYISHPHWSAHCVVANCRARMRGIVRQLTQNIGVPLRQHTTSCVYIMCNSAVKSMCSMTATLDDIGRHRTDIVRCRPMSCAVWTPLKLCIFVVRWQSTGSCYVVKLYITNFLNATHESIHIGRCYDVMINSVFFLIHILYAKST